MSPWWWWYFEDVIVVQEEIEKQEESRCACKKSSNHRSVGEWQGEVHWSHANSESVSKVTRVETENMWEREIREILKGLKFIMQKEEEKKMIKKNGS